MMEGEMNYIMPDRTVVYRAGDFFFETGDVSHRVESPEPSQHLLFEILPIDVDKPSLIPPRDK
jgi:quercetin dioxygenase-like cupin family protein